MKKVALVLFLLLSLCAHASAANFVEIYRDDGAVTYVDVDSIELRTSGNHGYVVAWIKMILRGEKAKEISKEYKQTIGHYMNFMAYNKNGKQKQMLSLNVYDKTGKSIDSSSWPFQTSRYQKVVPGSYGEDLYDFVVDYYNKNNKNK